MEIWINTKKSKALKMATTWINTEDSINVFGKTFILFKRKLDKKVIINLC